MLRITGCICSGFCSGILCLTVVTFGLSKHRFTKRAQMAKYLGIDKVLSILNIIKANGGLRASLYKMYRMDDLRIGTLIGEDKYGNKYYENKKFFYGRTRWVEYAPYYNMEYDGSQVPAEWFGWLHYKTDLTPDQEPFRPKYKWMLDHTENLSGTPGQYMPYSTTRPKIEPWIPPKC